MGLANFFDKTALAATQILTGFNLRQFKRRLEENPVLVQFDESAVRAREANVSLELTVNLLARLFPVLGISGPHEHADGLVSLARSINPAIQLIEHVKEAAVSVVIGKTAEPGGHPSFFVGSDGWTAHQSMASPVPSGNSKIPFGAAAAACIAVANVFRYVFRQELGGIESDRDISLSLLTFERESQPALELEAITNIGDLFLIGTGAIGNAFVWVLSKMDNLQGSLHVVDSERIELTNLQRYVLAMQTHAEQQTLKVELAVEAFRANSSVLIHPHAESWADFIVKRADWLLDTVALAVDTAQTRTEIQASLPRSIINSWAGEFGDLGISRHYAFDRAACVLCLYMPDGKQENLDEIITEALGLPKHKQQVEQIRQMLYTGAPVTAEHIGAIAAANNIPAADLESFVGQSLIAFYQKAVCGGVLLRLSGPDKSPVHTPMAFQSALAGIFLAAELVAHTAKLRSELPTTTRVNLLQPVGTQLSFPIAKHPSGRCICQDDDFLRVYRAKYGIHYSE